jgi:hypothetical protein
MGSFMMKAPMRSLGYIRITLLLSALAFASCSRMGEVKLPATPLLTGGLGWAVVKNSYVRLKEDPSEEARDINHLQRGAVFGLEARELGSGESSSRVERDKPSLWYKVKADGVEGWVNDLQLDIYSSRAQADKAAESYQ